MKLGRFVIDRMFNCLAQVSIKPGRNKFFGEKCMFLRFFLAVFFSNYFQSLAILHATDIEKNTMF